jgi:hypothetical protein
MAFLDLNSSVRIRLQHPFEDTNKPLGQPRASIAIKHEEDLSLHELHVLVVEVVIGVVEGDQLDED